MHAAGVLTRLALAATVLTTAAAVVDAPYAVAQTVQAGKDDSGISAGAVSPGGSGAQAGSSGGGARSRQSPVASAGGRSYRGPAGPSARAATSEVPPPSQGGGGLGSMLMRGLRRALDGIDAPRPAADPGVPGPEAPDPVALAQQAGEHVPLPTPTIVMAPGGDIPLLVNLPTFLWIDRAQWRPVSASASAGGVTSTVTATPERVVWDMGQGDTVTCDGPGAPYVPTLPDDAQPSDCSFTYRASSARAPDKTFTVTATIEWHVTWSASGAPGGGDLGISRRSSSTPVRVAEVQVLNTAARS